MSHQYQAVLWNPFKRRYDGIFGAFAVIYIAVFMAISMAVPAAGQSLSPEILMIRALGSCAFILLHFILAIGPLARISARFLPLLYNRRHAGVMLFMLGLMHGLLALIWYHGFGVIDPITSVTSSNPHYFDMARFPFEVLGITALIILFLMAATSHDFWLSVLSPPFWKAMHMGVYIAYTLLVMHVALGFLQTEQHPAYIGVVALGFITLCCLHIAAGSREWRNDQKPKEQRLSEDGYIDVLAISDVPMNRAKIIKIADEDRIAVFRHENKIVAVENACAHQNGPLGEGRIVDGCITCPWHGYQYEPETGCSPPPFTEKIATYPVLLHNARIWVKPEAQTPGEPAKPADIPAEYLQA